MKIKLTIVALFLSACCVSLANGPGVMITDVRAVSTDGSNRITIELDSPTAYFIDESGLPNRLQVEVLDCGISPNVATGKPIQVNKNGIKSISLSEDITRGRSYVEVLFSEPMRYVKRSPRVAQSIVIELFRPTVSETAKPESSTETTTVAPAQYTRIVHITGINFNPVADGVDVRIQADGPFEPQTTEEENTLVMEIPNALVSWGISEPKVFEVNSDPLKQIKVYQKSVNPEIVRIELERDYRAPFRLLSTSDSNARVLKVESAPAFRPAGSVPEMVGNLLRIPTNYSYTIDVELNDGDSVIVGNSQIADAIVNAAGDITINAQSVGRTSLEIWGKKGSIAKYLIEVYEDTSWIEEKIMAEIDDPGIKVRVVNNVGILEGQARSPQSAELARAVTQAYVQRIIDNMVVKQAVVDTERSILDALSDQNLTGVKVKVRGNVALLTGTVSDALEKQIAEQIASSYVGNVINSIEVDLPSDIGNAIKSQLNLPNVSVRMMKDAIILTGFVESAEERMRLLSLAQLYSQRVIDLTEIRPSRRADEELTAEIGITGITARWIGNEIYLDGTARSDLDSKFAESVARKYSDNVINRIRVTRPVQINIKVKVLEVNRSALSTLGISWSQGVTLTETNIPNQIYRIGRIARASLLNARVDALITSGSAKLLAEPNLTTINGQQASSLAGGEVPIITETTATAGVGRVAFGQESREYGVRLQVTPTVEEDGYINVELDSEVSDINRDAGFNTPVGQIGTFATRRVQASVRAKDGETAVLGGLLQQKEVVSRKRLPILGYIPILGYLFSYTRKEKIETELVYIMTPKIISENEPAPSISRDLAEVESSFVEQKRKPFTW